MRQKPSLVVALLVALLVSITAVAQATPNPLCPGHCADATSCGAATDCDRGACTFDDACLPGGAFAVSRALLDADTSINDGGWVSDVPGMTFADNAVRVAMPIATSAYYAKRTIPVAKGHRYFIRALMRVESSGFGFLEGQGVQSMRVADADPPVAIDAWEAVGFAFDNTGADADSELELRLYGTHDGKGAGPGASFKDFVVLELKDDFSVYLRVSVPSPAIAGVVAAPTVVLIGGNIFYGSLDSQPFDAGGATAWLDIGARFAADNATLDLTFSDAAGKIITPLTARLEVASAPNDAAILYNRTISSTTGSVGFYAPGRLPNPLHLASRFGTLADKLTDDPTLFRAQPGYAPAAQPRRFAAVTMFSWLDTMWGDWSAVNPFFDLAHDLGLNGINDVGMSASANAYAAGKGLTKLYSGFSPPGPLLGPGTSDYDLVALDQGLQDDWNANPLFQRTLAAYADHPDDLLVDMTDESYGLELTGPKLDTAFRRYLRAEALRCAAPDSETDCPPLSFGKQSWSEIRALDTMSSDLVDARRPDPADSAAARLFYWQMRFWSEVTATVYARTTAFLISQLPPSAKAPILSPQMGTPFGGYQTFRSGMDLHTVARSGALTGYHGEAFLGWNDWCDAQNISLYADYVDGALGADPALKRRASHVHANRGSGAHKALALAAHGIQFLDYYMYGPYQTTTGDGVAGWGQSSLFPLQLMQNASATLARSEPGLVDGERVTGPVAIMAAQSDTIWWSAKFPGPKVDASEYDVSNHTSALSYDETGTYLALTHGHHPVRFISEELLATDLDTNTRLLFVERKHVSSDAFAGMRSWTEAGGTLVLSGEAPTHDEYAQPSSERNTWLGVELGKVDYQPANVYTVSWPGVGTLTLQRPRRELTPTDPAATIVATYDDGTAAVVDLPRGNGKVRIIGFELGAAYRDLADPCLNQALPGALGKFPSSYSATIRGAVLDAATGLDRPAWASDPLVELTRLRTPGGGSLAVLNYTGAPLDSVTVTVPGVKGPVQALFGAPVTVGPDGRLTFALKDVEVLTWRDDDPDPGADDLGDSAGCGCTTTPGPVRGPFAAWSLIALLLLRRRGERRGSDAPQLK